MQFTTTWGTYSTYEEYRNALIAESENAALFLAGANATPDLLDNYADTHSIAIGYGFDLLVRNNDEINSYFSAASVAQLDNADANILNTVRPIFQTWQGVPEAQRATDQTLSNYLDQALTTAGLIAPNGANNNGKWDVLKAHYNNQLTIQLGSEAEARLIIGHHVETQIENLIDATAFPDSRERAVITSVLYQVPGSPTLLGLVNGTVAESNTQQRAKIWFEIRYYTGNPISRRNHESDAFGLYDGNTNAPSGQTAALETIDYLMRGEHISASGSRQNIYDLAQTRTGQVADFESQLAPSLTFLSNQLADGRELDAAYLMKDDEGVLDTANISSSGRDLIYGSENNDVILAGAENDVLLGNGGEDILHGGDGDDLLKGGADVDTLNGDAGDDTLHGEDGGDFLNGGAGNDTLHGEEGDDIMDGGEGDDTLQGGEGDDVLEGGAGNDTLEGGAGSDQMEGGNGNDIYRADSADTISDSDGAGRVELGGQTLTGGTRTEDDPEDTYHGGGNTYVLNGSTLTVNGGLTIEDFSNGDLGIDLETEDDDDDDDDGPDFDDAEQTTSPILLDLDGDGIETTTRNRYFDHDGDGIREQSAWVGSDDGLLALDLNGNGTIDSGRELFGNQTMLANGKQAENGYEALDDLDSNDDGVISAADAAWSDLRVWRDANGNGITDAGELLTLDDVGIASLNLTATTSDDVDGFDNEHRLQSSMTMADGSERATADVWFQVDRTQRLAQSGELPENIEALPDAQGFGELSDLRWAMAENATLRDMVEAYMAETDPAVRSEMIEPLIFEWAGVTNVDPYSRDPSRIYGHVMDARQLVTLETLVGRSYLGTWCWQERDPNPHGQAAPKLIAEFTRYANFVEAQLLAQTHYADQFEWIYSEFNTDGKKVFADFDAFENMILSLEDQGQMEMITEIVAIAQDLGTYSSSYRQDLQGSFARLIVEEPLLTPILDGQLIVGTENSDSLYGRNSQAEVIDGGAGDDRLYGRDGDDVYFFEQGDGKDRIFDSQGNDTIRLGAGYSPDNVRVTRDATTVWLEALDNEGELTGDRIQIDNFFNFDGSYDSPIETVQFDSGVRWTLADLTAQIMSGVDENDNRVYGSDHDDQLDGLAGDDILWGYAGNDQLQGGDGEDVINAGTGDDVIDGGNGNDQLTGDKGSDSYHFSHDHGSDIINNYDESAASVDRIVFDETISIDAVSASRVGDDLLLHTGGDGNLIRVTRFFNDNGESPYALDEVRFADGTVWDQAYLMDAVKLATEAADTIVGYDSQDETISALGGDDQVYGRGGNDHIQGNEGDDRLYGEQGNDVLEGGTGNDTLSGGEGNDRLFGGEGADRLQGDDGDDTLSGGEGDDLLDGGRGHDFLAGGLGDDRLSGGRGDDAYYFARGDGHDVIDDQEGEITIYVNDLEPDNAIFRREGRNLVITFADNSDTDVIELENWFDPISFFAYSGIAFGIQGGVMTQITPSLLENLTMTATQLGDYLYGNERDNSIDGLDGDDVIHGERGNDTLRGDAGDDVLHGDEGDDVLDGGEGDDRLFGGSGNDELRGGQGDDLLSGGSGDDLYHIAAGDGHDVITDADGTDQVNLLDFAEGDLLFRREGNDLLILDRAQEAARQQSGDASTSTLLVRVSGQFAAGVIAPGTAIEQFLLANGLSLSIADTALQVLQGSELDDVIEGHASDDTIHAGAGNDTIAAGSGDDIVTGGLGDDSLNGGAGNDSLDGGAGNDVLVDLSGDNVLNGGDGDDTLEGTGQLYGGAGADTLSGSGSLDGGTGDDTLNGNGDLHGGEGNDQLSGSGMLFGDAGNDEIRGSGTLDGGDGNDVVQGLVGGDVLLGGAGNDTLYADDLSQWPDDTAHNQLTGGTGDDTLYGGFGSDTYYYNLGDGSDRIIETQLSDDHTYPTVNASTDTFVFGEGIVADDLNFIRSGVDLIIEAPDGGSMTVENWFYPYSNNRDLFKIEQLTFVNGDVLKIDDVENRVVYQGSDGEDQMFGYYDRNETLDGGAGNDYIDGAGGDDVLYGGAGDDQLQGGAGNDVYDGGDGDDKYVYHNGSGQDVIDQTGGGTDWLFFDVPVEQLSFVRDGDDLIITVDGDDQQKVTVTDHFLGGDKQIDYVQPSEGNAVSAQAIANIIAGDEDGGEFDQVITGSDAAEQLGGTNGNDRIVGLGGNDQLFGFDGNDQLEGGDGDDFLAGGSGSGAERDDDILIGGAGNDTLYGEGGNDLLVGGAGNDHYYYDPDSGVDTIDNSGGGSEYLFMRQTALDQLNFYRDGDDLIVRIGDDAGQEVRVLWHFLGGEHRLEYLVDGSNAVTSVSQIEGQVQPYPGTDTPPPDEEGPGEEVPPEEENPGSGDEHNVGDVDPADYDQTVVATGAQTLGSNGRDYMTGRDEADQMFGFRGDDYLSGGAGNDYLSGGNGSYSGSGNDILIGGDGDDVLVGEDGNDELLGGTGNDHYYIRAQNGVDLIADEGGSQDVLFFNGVSRDRLHWYRQDDDLVIRVDDDSNHQVTVLGQFAAGSDGIEMVQPGDGGFAIPASEFAAMASPLNDTVSPANSSALALMATMAVSESDEDDTESGQVTMFDRGTQRGGANMPSWHS